VELDQVTSEGGRDLLESGGEVRTYRLGCPLVLGLVPSSGLPSSSRRFRRPLETATAEVLIGIEGSESSCLPASVPLEQPAKGVVERLEGVPILEDPDRLPGLRVADP
jgi:hypothetical protein